MSKERDGSGGLGLSNEKLKSLARTLLPILRAYLSSEEGKRDFAEWTAKQQLNSKNIQDKSF